jgi:polysaccharide export outer membrane protein
MKSCSKGAVIGGILVSVACTGSLWGRDTTAQNIAEATAATTTDSSTRPIEGPTSIKPDESFVIGNDDVLSINVWKEQDLTRAVPVRSDGKISLPLIGEIQAAGRTPVQLEQDIAASLKSFITDPQVTVIVQQINSQKFNILGRVAKPGSYSLSAAVTVLDAIAAAGGFQDFAKQKDVYILRKDPNGTQSRIPFNYKDVIRGKHPEENINLKPNDTIVVP